MSDNLPSTVPSLARAFEPERSRLKETLRGTQAITDVVVLDARRALDKTGDGFVKTTDDPALQKAGLWLIEMVKSGAAVLDQGTSAKVEWTEVSGPKTSIWAGRGLFYGAAGIFALTGFVQGSALVVIAAAVLAALRAFDPSRWKQWMKRLPFTSNSPPLLEDESGKHLKVDAHVLVDVDGYVDSLADALRTADHLLLRLAEPAKNSHWSDNQRLTGFVQNLLEAEEAKDGTFALKVVSQELSSVLAAEGIERIDYKPKTAHLFDVLPAIGEEKTRQAAPALIKDGHVLRRGTVWGAS